jgi:folate-binding protein YgfZ
MIMNLPAAFAVDVSNRTEITATGADRVRILHGLCTNDVKALSPGRGCEAFITTLQGKTLGHVLLQVAADRIVLDTVPQQWERLGKHLNKYVVTEDVTYAETSADRRLWLLAGENIAQVLTGAGVKLPAEILATGEVAVPAAAPQLTRVPLLQPDAFFLRASQGESAAVEAWLAKIGVPVIEADEELTSLRILSGWPEFGRDFCEDHLPQEVNRTTSAISFRKGCYLGQETIARLENLGHVNKLLSRIRFAAGAVITAGAELQHEGKTVGKLTSVGSESATGQPIAFAILRANLAKVGTKFDSNFGPAETF